MDFAKYKEELKQMREMAERDANLVFFCVRNWELTKAADLEDLAWAGYRDGCVRKNDAIYIIELLEKYIEKQENN